MSNSRRRPGRPAPGIARRAAAGLLTLAAMTPWAAPAAAQPPPPPPGPLVPAISGVDTNSVLGQNPVPSPPGAGPVAVPDLNAFNNAYGVPQYETPSAPGAGDVFDVAPGHETDDVNGREWLGRYIDLYRDGRLTGALLGQTPQGDIGARQ